ncbi:MAG: hypothetical protein H7222_10795 [Methylotenera sp.]|nr:hypothetical protein [Oligoflexia bacterium]
MASLCVMSSACSTLKGEKSAANIATTGPSVVSAKSQPSTFELDRQMNPTSGADVVAEVKDYSSNIAEVNLRFIHVPMTVPMTHVGGTTWTAHFTAEQLKVLAVGGQTIAYDANVIARNEDGQTAVGAETVKVAVKAPDLTQQDDKKKTS